MATLKGVQGLANASPASLADPKIAKLAAAQLLAALPMQARVEESSLKEGTLIRGDHDDASGLPAPPEEITLICLRRRARVWIPTIVGVATLDDRQGIRRWRVASLGPEPVDGPIYAAYAADPSQLADAVRELMNSLKATVASGYVGARLGQQLARGDALLQKAKIVGVLVEVRDGPLAGARYYYDLLPRTTVNEAAAQGGTIATTLAWSRHLMGYGFKFHLGSVVDALTLTPKLGVWHVDATVPVSRDAAGRVGRVINFDLGTALGIGAEGGAELVFGRSTLRPWVELSGGTPLDGTRGTVTSRRAGLDAYLAAGPLFSAFGSTYQVAFLAFALGESVILQARETSADEAGRLELDGAYAGVGAALSW